MTREENDECSVMLEIITLSDSDLENERIERPKMRKRKRSSAMRSSNDQETEDEYQPPYYQRIKPTIHYVTVSSDEEKGAELVETSRKIEIRPRNRNSDISRFTEEVPEIIDCSESDDSFPYRNFEGETEESPKKDAQDREKTKGRPPKIVIPDEILSEPEEVEKNPNSAEKIETPPPNRPQRDRHVTDHYNPLLYFENSSKDPHRLKLRNRPSGSSRKSEKLKNGKISLTKSGKLRKKSIRWSDVMKKNFVETEFSEYAQSDDDEPFEPSTSSCLVAVVVRKYEDGIPDDEKSSYNINPRVKVVSKYKSLIPKTCNEARRAQQSGGYERPDCYEWPGIASRKFTLADMEKFGKNKVDWPIQQIFAGGKDEDGDEISLVYYEGWTSQTISVQKTDEFRKTAPEIIKDAEVLRNFIDLRRRRAEDLAFEMLDKHGDVLNFKEAVEMNFVERSVHRKDDETLVQSLRRSHRSVLFWLYHDLSYFHTMANREMGLAAVFYLAYNKGYTMPPYYAYTTVNIIDMAAYEACLRKPASRRFEKLAGKRAPFGGGKSVCENGKKCKCDQRFNLLYGNLRHAQNLQYTKKGRLDLSDFKIEYCRVVVECSDVCGCSSKCPRRSLQRGQQKPLVVNYESNFKGFGLRVAEDIEAGSLVCEYTGEMILLDEAETVRDVKGKQRIVKQHRVEEKNENEDGENKTEMRRDLDGVVDTSYDAQFELMDRRLVVRALSKGNIARFANHSCSANTAFVEVYSRRFESDPLIPRIALYALKDIKMGDEVTVAYWTSGAEKRNMGVKCECNSPNCIKFLPTC